MLARILPVFVAALTLGACTTTLDTAKPADGISRGYSYQLPRLAYDIEVERQLVKCPTVVQDRISFDVTAKAAARLAPGETIVVDYLAVANALKTADLAMENHPNGMLKSINLKVNDRTADVISEGVKAAVSIGKIAIGLPGSSGVAGAAPAAPAPTEYLRCTAAFQQALEGLPALKAAVKAAETKAKASATSLEELEAASRTGKPAPAADLAAAKRMAREDTEALERAKKAVVETTAMLTLIDRSPLDLPNTMSNLPMLLAQATDGKTQPSSMFEIFIEQPNGAGLVIPLRADMSADVSLILPVGFPATPAGKVKAARAVERIRKKVADAESSGSQPFETVLNVLKDASVVVIAGPLGGGQQVAELPKAEPCAGDKRDCGIVYRSPASGRLRICGGGTSDRPADAAACWGRLVGDSSLVFQEDRQVPQFGNLMSLPLKNGAFSQNELSAQFAEDGRIVSVSYKKPVAEAAAGAASFNTALGGLTELITFEKGKELRDLAAKKALYEAQLANQTALKNLTPSERQQLLDEKAVIDAQIEVAKSQATLLLQQQPSQVTQIGNETAVIEAEIARIKKLIELKRAQDELSTLEALESDKDE